ncbi:MAG: transcription termination/antitermination protein NusG [Sulfuricurvum sp. GWF2_44_89]|jgi:transcriptional antiterminator NusG|uniref:Transcription termination/antitermination protein NusG n=1 Tax=Sulfuricurvum kujiense TaxID=148813 RepID=A0A2D3WK16_9BACT|nr:MULTISPECIES: transcription termination/antitermination protein NusG [Sulfuricurvum]OHD79472.1 MAG: transcription termination/antitermination protein NusG [Sulfuricurvum sp. GWF2_44_89]OHD94612.1 MAG: transcription termination/antitermination protein NusG [Sulfuricurvum sp. RIFOXYD12_FULL_44_77]OHD95467.1 MAG: transcription termination/antitermination protein NusG [Sulfuricurvum sp. RIFOXYD2_FULL_44_160]DAB39077.1 MAG TPA: transcription termination/antitermination protein NusG [Sulfuricurvum
MAHRWYSIQTYAGSERSVKAAIENIIAENHLEEVITEVIVPTEDVIEVKNGKKKITERSLYSGYVFANMDLSIDLQHRIQSLPRVAGFIGESNKPTPLSENDIAVILDRVTNRSAPKPKVFFDNGEMVRIVDGPFANFTGTVDEYDLEHGTLKLNVSIFGRSTPVDISYTQVEKII